MFRTVARGRAGHMDSNRRERPSCAVNLVVFGHSRVVRAGGRTRRVRQPSRRPGRHRRASPPRRKRAASSPKFDALVRRSRRRPATPSSSIARSSSTSRRSRSSRRGTEGHWNLGTALYEVDRFAEARDAFRKVVAAPSRERDGLGPQGAVRVPAEELRRGARGSDPGPQAAASPAAGTSRRRALPHRHPAHPRPSSSSRR